MNKIVLTGNGFDRAHKLKTSYGDFVQYMVEESINNNTEIRNSVINVGPLHSYHKSYEYIKANFHSLLTASKKTVPNKIHFENNFFRSLLLSYFEADWINIEEFYFKHLNAANGLELIKKLNAEFEIIKIHLEKYLAIQTSGTNGKLIPEFFDIFYKDKPENTLFLNFNYTPTLSLYLDNMPSRKEIIYIHGELHSEENPIIFGYGDETDSRYISLLQKNDNSYLRNLKRQQYNLATSYQKLQNFISKSDNLEVYCIGHSFGSSDKTLLQEIFENPKVTKIVPFYHKNKEGYRNLNDNLSRMININTLNTKIVNFPNCSAIPQLVEETKK